MDIVYVHFTIHLFPCFVSTSVIVYQRALYDAVGPISLTQHEEHMYDIWSQIY